MFSTNTNFESVYDSHLVEFADTEAVGPGSQMDVFKLPTLFLEALLLRLHFSFFSFSYSQKLQWKFSDFIPNKYECESIPLALTPHILSYASVWVIIFFGLGAFFPSPLPTSFSEQTGRSHCHGRLKSQLPHYLFRQRSRKWRRALLHSFSLLFST